MKQTITEPVATGLSPSWLRSERLQIGLALLAVYLIWGGTYLATKFAIVSMPVFLMIGVRFLTAGTLLFCFLKLRGVPTPSAAEWRGAGTLGVLLIVLGMGGTAGSQALGVSSSLAALGAAATPLWVAVISSLRGQRPAGRELFGLGLGFSGIAILNLQGEMRANALGAIILLLGSLGWAFGTVIAPGLRLPKGLMATAAEMMLAGAILLTVGLASGQRLQAVPTATSLLALLYLIICGSMIAFSAYNFLLRRVRPALATSTAYVNPLVAVWLGASLGGERIGVLGMSAMAIIIAGVVLVVTSRKG